MIHVSHVICHVIYHVITYLFIEVQQLHMKETWGVETDDEYGGTTQLPVLFENIVNETIQHLHEVVVQNKPGEAQVILYCILYSFHNISLYCKMCVQYSVQNL